MSNRESNDTERAGYFLPEDDRTRLTKLRDHMEFLSRLAQPRTYDEEQDDPPEVSHGDLATCLAMLAEQAELVLEAMAWRPSPNARPKTRTAAEADDPAIDPDEAQHTRQEASAAQPTPAASVPEAYVFGVTIDQADALDRLVQMLMAHGDVIASGHEDDLADDTVPALGLAISEGADAVREILDQVQEQLIQPATTSRCSVREERAVYGPVPKQATRLSLH
ncbi:hypothetical protein MNO14_06675 [Luteimonas sp. S4-F44]|uniref:XAC0095 family protein n=1 Tax=Luteimonas sp. S4-F44 TaxID=2925842 RepID=UPI001F535B89|nr:hypothetical protein [Luteimonas sp. S4-F44]UNK43738.1 hypothetical protein MNO14_06675 [Luteimonas sp. S4-F44]